MDSDFVGLVALTACHELLHFTVLTVPEAYDN